MPNRKLTPDEKVNLFAPLITEVRNRLKSLCLEDEELHWALRRKLSKELIYDERKKPNNRRALKALKRKEQGGLCAMCASVLPAKYVVLDRLEAMGGYVASNTRLLCESCDRKTQEQRGYR